MHEIGLLRDADPLQRPEAARRDHQVIVGNRDDPQASLLREHFGRTRRGGEDHVVTVPITHRRRELQCSDLRATEIEMVVDHQHLHDSDLTSETPTPR